MDIIQTALISAKPSGHLRSIGAILVDQGKLTLEAAEAIQRLALEKSIRFGEAALQLGLLTEEDVESAVRSQYYFPYLSIGDKGVDPAVIAAYDPKNNFAAHLRALRSELLFRWLNDCARKVLAIASPGRGEGRSCLAANLAVAFAQIGKRTLLIDADLRNPRQHRLFNVSNSHGLSALLTGRAQRRIVHRIHPEISLSVVPAGPVPPNPEELLARPQFAVALSRLVADYDVALLDTPPAMPTADAQLIAAQAGNALLLAQSNHTGRASLLSVMASFKQARVNVVGSVVNDLPHNWMPSG